MCDLAMSEPPPGATYQLTSRTVGVQFYMSISTDLMDTDGTPPANACPAAATPALVRSAGTAGEPPR
jgi:hypothetical protein